MRSLAARRYTASVIRTRLIAAAVALAAVCTMPGPAAAQTQPDERAAAREFAYAAYRLRVRIKASTPAMKQVAKDLDTPACKTALGDDADHLPKRAEPGVAALLLELELGASFAPVKGAYEQFMTELDRVPTADPALIAGRDVWRSSVEAISQTGPVPADLCDQRAALAARRVLRRTRPLPPSRRRSTAGCWQRPPPRRGRPAGVPRRAAPRSA